MRLWPEFKIKIWIRESKIEELTENFKILQFHITGCSWEVSVYEGLAFYFSRHQSSNSRVVETGIIAIMIYLGCSLAIYSSHNVCEIFIFLFLVLPN